MKNFTKLQKTEIKIKKLLKVLNEGNLNSKLTKDDLLYFKLKTTEHLEDLIMIKETLNWSKGQLTEDYFDLPLSHIDEYTNGAYYILVPRKKNK